MPAITQTENGQDADVVPSSDDARPAVTDYLDMALNEASDSDMSASELMGLFFYYAHSIAESYRQDALAEGG